MASGFDEASQRQADGPPSPSGRGLPAYYSGQEANKAHGVLTRTLSHFNPFKVSLQFLTPHLLLLKLIVISSDAT